MEPNEKIDVEKMKLKKNDVILLRYEIGDLPVDTLRSQMDVLKEMFPDNTVICLPWSYSLASMSRAEAIAYLDRLKKDIEPPAHDHRKKEENPYQHGGTSWWDDDYYGGFGLGVGLAYV